MIEIGQVFVRKGDKTIRTEVVGLCEHDGIEHYLLRVCGTDLKRHIVLSEEGLKLAYRIPSKTFFETIK